MVLNAEPVFMPSPRSGFVVWRQAGGAGEGVMSAA